MVVAGKFFQIYLSEGNCKNAQLACQSGFILQAFGKADVFTGIIPTVGKVTTGRFAGSVGL